MKETSESHTNLVGKVSKMKISKLGDGDGDSSTGELHQTDIEKFHEHNFFFNVSFQIVKETSESHTTLVGKVTKMKISKLGDGDGDSSTTELHQTDIEKFQEHKKFF